MGREFKDYFWEQAAVVKEAPSSGKIYNTFSRAPKDPSSNQDIPLFSKGSINSQVDQIKLD